MTEISCSECPYCILRSVKNRNVYGCVHPRISKMVDEDFGKQGRAVIGYGSKLKLKKSPRWCPKK